MNRRRPARTAILVAVAAVAAGTLVAGLVGCSGDDQGTPELHTSGAYVPEPVSRDVAAGFLTIENTGDADDRLTSVTSDAAGTVEMHETVDNAMRPVDSLPVPAGGTLRLNRGGNHLMLLDLDRELTEGDTISLELHFAEAEPLTLDVPVEAPTYTGEE
ncbi:copper chaperone PCu(A)C [Streptomyces sp. B6B3]|uniref:copper chaperone PCu(A)C n=1 Tax=Streptomyces sp. B6B3 TaxID=3153570 RepID=UPI00325EDBFC